MIDVDPLLEAEVEDALAVVPPCTTPGCVGHAQWALIKPCGHISMWCDICEMDTSETIARSVEAGEEFTCPADGYRGFWSQFRWELS